MRNSGGFEQCMNSKKMLNLSLGRLLVTALACIGHAEGILLPGCQTVAPPQKNLTSVRTSFSNSTAPAHPFGVVFSHRNDIAFVALNTTLGVLNTSTFTSSLIHEIPLPAPYLTPVGAAGIALTHNGRHVLVTTFSTALIVVDVARAITGSPDAVVGVLNCTSPAGNSAIEVTVTHDDKYAFVSQEDGSLQTGGRGTIEVFALHKPTANKSVSGTSVGYLELGNLVVGTALSPDGRTLYATSEMASNSTTEGTLSIIDVAKLKRNPGNALISSVPAGCGPIRVVVSGDGRVVWVTARESNALLAFNASALITNPNGALLA